MNDAWFFVGIFVFIFLIWIATGGPVHPISFTGPTLHAPGALGGGTYLSLPKAPFGIGGTEVSLPGSSAGGGSFRDEHTQSLTGTVFGESSPYKNLVSLNSYVSGAGGDPAYEYLELSVPTNAGAPVDISGWTLASGATGAASIIPKGTETPTSGVINAAQDIVLLPGTHVLFISGPSPIGASFRDNKCIGYFSSFQKFSPGLPQNCPTPSNELSANYGPDYIRDAKCIDYVQNLSRCEVALTPPTGSSSACQSFVSKYLNYNGCVQAHKTDADFSGDTWRVYLGRTTALWRTRHEIVKLLDASGKTVAAFSY